MVKLIAAENNHKAAILALAKLGADIRPNPDGETIVDCCRTWTFRYHLCFSWFRADVNISDKNGVIPIWNAAKNNHKLLLLL